MRAAAKAALLLLAVSLAVPKPGVAIGGLHATATDFLFLLVAGLVAVTVIRRDARVRWDASFFILAAYFVAMLVSTLAAADPLDGAAKLAAQAYLLSLPVLVLALVDDIDDLRRLCLAWLAGSAVTATVGTATLLLYAVGVERSAIDYALHHFGTLPPGNYPRLESTFSYPAMLCNYLTVSLAILFLCCHQRWIGPRAGGALFALILPTATFTLTPGLGGIALLLGAWIFVAWNKAAPRVAAASLAIGSLLALASVAVAMVAPAVHPTASFLIHLPEMATPLAPSVRLMTWIEAARAFLDHPFLGAGLGADPIEVAFVTPSGVRHVLTDAHNVFLNVAMHSGVAGLATILLLIGAVAHRIRPWCPTGTNMLALVLGFAWLDAFVFQGLTGSYEEARHLWLLLGLFIAAGRFHPRPDGAGAA